MSPPVTHPTWRAGRDVGGSGPAALRGRAWLRRCLCVSCSRPYAEQHLTRVRQNPSATPVSPLIHPAPRRQPTPVRAEHPTSPDRRTRRQLDSTPIAPAVRSVRHVGHPLSSGTLSGPNCSRSTRRRGRRAAHSANIWAWSHCRAGSAPRPRWQQVVPEHHRGGSALPSGLGELHRGPRAEGGVRVTSPAVTLRSPAVVLLAAALAACGASAPDRG